MPFKAQDLLEFKQIYKPKCYSQVRN